MAGGAVNDAVAGCALISAGGGFSGTLRVEKARVCLDAGSSASPKRTGCVRSTSACAKSTSAANTTRVVQRGAARGAPESNRGAKVPSGKTKVLMPV